MHKPLARLWLADALRKAIEDESSRHFPNETGGILVGYWTETADVAVTNIVGPGPRARHAHHSFVPDHRYQREELAKEYERSGRVYTYLGDWHSHPDGLCSLSCRDRLTLARIGMTPAARVPEPVMLIVAGDPERWEVRAWRLSRSRRLLLRAITLPIARY
jgi:integrative and conjugative element protein (TIGR02256 family)